MNKIGIDYGKGLSCGQGRKIPSSGCSSTGPLLNVSGCSVPGRTAKAIPPEIEAKIRSHPCYSEEAHHHFARIHLAVAPACNIQCNYCNRKYDCANESRPGVTGERLTPEQAADKVRAVRARLPNLSVVGIAGPGDPLANPEQTFRTFELVSAISPDLQLCLSTNGLMLPEHIERIKKYNVNHVTITINAVDPEIGALIYPWVYYRRKKYTDRDGAALLLEKQMEGLDLLRAEGILCKINSVLIPGMNDRHLMEVHRAVTERGAFLHNVMPLISAPEYGTHFGLIGQRGPTEGELRAVQASLSGGVPLMKHCKQCRADAVGLLGEDLSSEFTLTKLAERKSAESDPPPAPEERPLRVAVATRGQGLINEHFGQADEFDIYDVSTRGVLFAGRRRAESYCLGGHGDRQALHVISGLLQDCRAVFVARIGECPRRDMTAAGIEPVDSFAGRPIEPSLMEFFHNQKSEKIAGMALLYNEVVKSNEM